MKGCFNYSEHVDPFYNTDYIANGDGLIVWRRGTGGNVELLNLQVTRTGEGCATRLLRGMLEQLRGNPPYYTVFGFTRVENTSAQAFYEASGFGLSLCRGVYKDGMCVVFSAEYKALLKRHGIPGL